jgi:hypothetical protein
MTSNDAQQRVLADGQEKAPRKTLPWPTAQGHAEMMHDALQTRRAARERTRSCRREPFREDPLAAGRQDAAEPDAPRA